MGISLRKYVFVSSNEKTYLPSTIENKNCRGLSSREQSPWQETKPRDNSRGMSVSMNEGDGGERILALFRE